MTLDAFSRHHDAGQIRIQSFAFFIVAVVCVSLSMGLFLNASSEQPCKIQLENRINPNNATLGSLVRLPGIGLVRATAILSYRENANSTAPAFKNCDDLQNIKGIGPKTVQNICQWLKFEWE